MNHFRYTLKFINGCYVVFDNLEFDNTLLYTNKKDAEYHCVRLNMQEKYSGIALKRNAVINI